MLRLIDELVSIAEKALKKTNNEMKIGSSNIQADRDRTAGWSKELLFDIRDQRRWFKYSGESKFSGWKVGYREMPRTADRIYQAGYSAMKAFVSKGGNCGERADLTMYFLVNGLLEKPEFKLALERGDIKLSTQHFPLPFDHVFVRMIYSPRESVRDSKPITVYIDPWVNIDPTNQKPMVFTAAEFEDKMTKILAKLHEEELLQSVIPPLEFTARRMEYLHDRIVALIACTTEPTSLLIFTDIEFLLGLIINPETDPTIQIVFTTQLFNILDGTIFKNCFPELTEEVDSWLKIISSYRRERENSLLGSVDAKYSPMNTKKLTPENLLDGTTLETLIQINYFLKVFEVTYYAETHLSPAEMALLNEKGVLKQRGKLMEEIRQGRKKGLFDKTGSELVIEDKREGKESKTSISSEAEDVSKEKNLKPTKH